MKKITLLFLLLFIYPSLAFSWGIMEPCLARVSQDKRCFVEKLSRAGNYPCISVKLEGPRVEGVSAQEFKQISQVALKDLSAAFHRWFGPVRSQIVQAGRAEEFADFLNIYPNGVRVFLQDKNTPSNPQCLNLALYLSSGGGSTCADANALENRIRWYTFNYRFHDGGGYSLSYRGCPPASVVTHEVGHLMGLADLYWNKLNHDSNITQEFSLLSVGISTYEMEKYSVMTTAQENYSVRCDDLDGIINMWDVLLAKQGKTSPRWEKGWTSFCPAYQAKNFRYAYGQPYRSEEEKNTNKRRIEAINWFEKGALEWQKEYDRLGDEIARLNKKLETASEQGVLTTLDLMDSARMNYLAERQKKVGIIYSSMNDMDDNDKIGFLGVYDKVQALIAQDPDIAPGKPLYSPKKLAQATPYEYHLYAAVEKKKHVCLSCGKEIEPDEELSSVSRGHVFYFHEDCPRRAKASQSREYIRKYRYDREQTKAPMLSYAELYKKALREGIDFQVASMPASPALSMVSVPPLEEVAKSAAVPDIDVSATHSAKGTLPPTASMPVKGGLSAKQVSAPKDSRQQPSAKPQGKPKVLPAAPESKPVRKTPTTRPESSSKAKAKCYVCGKEMEEGAYHSFAQSKHVHKKGECALRAFTQYHKTDAESLARYEGFYFLHVPQDVVQAKADMRSLGITVADVRNYISQQQETQNRLLQEQQASRRAESEQASLREKCRFYMNVSQADVDLFKQENKGALTKAENKKSAGGVLSKKQERLLRQYNQLLENFKITQQCAVLDKKTK